MEFFCKLYECKWHTLLLRNNVICKDKWGVIYEDFKHISYYMDSVGNNIRYWDCIPQEKTSLNMFQQFKKVMYKLIDSFVGACPMLHPLHLCDPMALYDNVIRFLVLQLDVKSLKNNNLGFFISSQQKALMEFSTPPTLAKGNPST